MVLDNSIEQHGLKPGLRWFAPLPQPFSKLVVNSGIIYAVEFKRVQTKRALVKAIIGINLCCVFLHIFVMTMLSIFIKPC